MIPLILFSLMIFGSVVNTAINDDCRMTAHSDLEPDYDPSDAKQPVWLSAVLAHNLSVCVSLCCSQLGGRCNLLSFTTRPNEDVEKDFNCTLFFCEDMSNCRIVPETDEVVLIRMFKPFSASSIVLSSQEHSSSENDKLTLQFNLRLTDVMNNSEQPITTEYIIDKNYTVNMSFSSTYLLGNNSKEIDMARIISTTPYTTPPARYHSHPSLQRYFTKTASLPTVHNQTFINYFNITTRPPTDTADAINKASYISNTTSPDIANTEYKYSFDVKTTSNSTPHKINYTTMKTLFRTFTHNSELLSVTIKPPKTASMSLINVTQSLHDFYTRQAMNRTSRKEDLDDTLMASNDSVIASTPNNVSGTQYVADSDTILSLNNTVSTLAEKESAMTVYLTDKFTMPTINNTVTTLGMNDNEVTQIVFDTLSNKSSNTPFLTEDRMISLKNHKTETTVTNPTEYFEMNSSLQTVMTTMNNFTTQLSEGYSALSEGNTEITNGKTFRSTFISNMSSNTTIVIPTNRTVLPLPFDINTTVSSSTNRSDNAALISTRRLPILEKPVSPSNRDIYENKIMTINYAGNSSSSIVSYFNYTGDEDASNDQTHKEFMKEDNSNLLVPVLVCVLAVGCLFISVISVLIGFRCVNEWKKRDYAKIETQFLLDSMNTK